MTSDPIKPRIFRGLISIFPANTEIRALAQNSATNMFGGNNIVEASADRQNFKNCSSAFEGIGPKTIEIFTQEAAQVIL